VHYPSLVSVAGPTTCGRRCVVVALDGCNGREEAVDGVEVEAEPAGHGGFVAEEDAEAVVADFSFALELAGE
jgi:hypothetical protein